MYCRYAGYKAQFTALQGRSSVAVSTALDILLRTNDRITSTFNASLVFLALAAMLLAFVHLHFIAFLTLCAVFGYFVYDMYSFQAPSSTLVSSLPRIPWARS